MKSPWCVLIHHQLYLFHKVIIYNYLNCTQINNIPNPRNVFLDLVFTNVEDLVVTIPTDKLIKDSFHHIAYSLTIHYNEAHNEFYYDFRNIDFLAINNYILAIDWNSLLKG